jgi:hypothetical protein
MEQVIDRLLAKMDVIKAKMDAKLDANLREMKAEIRAQMRNWVPG